MKEDDGTPPPLYYAQEERSFRIRARAQRRQRELLAEMQAADSQHPSSLTPAEVEEITTKVRRAKLSGRWHHLGTAGKKGVIN